MSQADASVDATRFVDFTFSTKIHPLLRQVPVEEPLQRTVVGLCYRGIVLVQGLAKLDRASHLPLVLAATRGMLELVVDIILLSGGDRVERARQLEAWEESARFKVADLTLRFVKKRGRLSKLEEPYVSFISRVGERVRESRRKYWLDSKGKPRHPDRWTGGSLAQDVKIADGLAELDLEWFYETEYRRLNFQVHGSTLAGQRGLDFEAFSQWFGLGHRKTCEFALFAVEKAMEILEMQEGRQMMAEVRYGWQFRAAGFNR